MDRRFEVCEAEVGREVLLVPVLGERLPSLAIEVARDVARDGRLWGTYLDHFWLETNLSVLRFVGGPPNMRCPRFQATRKTGNPCRQQNIILGNSLTRCLQCIFYGDLSDIARKNILRESSQR